MRDWHCHLLPGLDDGARDAQVALLMARQLARAGFREVFCTPHRIAGLYPTTVAQVEEGVAQLQEHLVAAGIPLRLWPGMEYYLDEYFPEQLERPRLLGETDRILVEVPSHCDEHRLRDGVFRILRKGLVPVIAHPERSKIFGSREETGLLAGLRRAFGGAAEDDGALRLLGELRTSGCLFQGNLGSFSGYYGRGVQQRARQLAAAGIYNCYGSDGHTAEMLASSLTQGVGAVGSAAVA